MISAPSVTCSRRPWLGALAATPRRRGSGQRAACRTRTSRLAHPVADVRGLAAPGIRPIAVRIAAGRDSWQTWDVDCSKNGPASAGPLPNLLRIRPGDHGRAAVRERGCEYVL